MSEFKIYDFNQIVPTLTDEERHQLFTMIEQNRELLKKMMPGQVLVEHANHGNQDPRHPLVQSFDAWKFDQLTK